MNYDPFEITHMARWAAQECEWQESGEMSVSRLIDATFYAIGTKAMGSRITPLVIQSIGRLIDPRNESGFRQEPVWIGTEELTPWGEISGDVVYWVDQRSHMTPTEAFKAFEEIHPFIDGNGRTGAILYNWLNGTLEPGRLVFPPNVFGDPRR